MVGMDALSAGDRLKMEAARSIREDFLHQNSFHEIDTYTPLDKQLPHDGSLCWHSMRSQSEALEAWCNYKEYSEYGGS